MLKQKIMMNELLLELSAIWQVLCRVIYARILRHYLFIANKKLSSAEIARIGGYYAVHHGAIAPSVYFFSQKLSIGIDDENCKLL